MSDYETHYGKLRKVDLQGKTIEEFFEQKCKEEGIEKSKFFETFEEAYQFETDNYYKYTRVGDDIWELFDHIESDDLDHANLINNNDGTYTLSTTFYNGGVCLSDIIEEELSKL